MAKIWATMLPFRNALWRMFPFSSLASAKQRLSVSGMIPMSVPVYSFPWLVVTMTVLSISAASSPKNFLWATDNLSPFHFIVFLRT